MGKGRAIVSGIDLRAIAAVLRVAFTTRTWAITAEVLDDEIVAAIQAAKRGAGVAKDHGSSRALVVVVTVALLDSTSSTGVGVPGTGVVIDLKVSRTTTIVNAVREPTAINGRVITRHDAEGLSPSIRATDATVRRAGDGDVVVLDEHIRALAKGIDTLDCRARQSARKLDDHAADCLGDVVVVDYSEVVVIYGGLLTEEDELTPRTCGVGIVVDTNGTHRSSTATTRAKPSNLGCGTDGKARNTN